MLSLHNGNEFVWAYEWGPYDMTVASSSSLNADVVDMTFKAVDTFQLTLTRQTTGNLVTTQFKQIVHGPEDDIKLIAQKRLVQILERVDRVDSENDGKRLTFHSGPWRIAFDRLPLTEPVPGQEWDGQLPLEKKELVVVPATYFVNGKFEKLYSGLEFPIRAAVTVSSRSSIAVVIQAVNTASYDIYYEPADGWVTKVVPRGMTRMSGPVDRMEAEKKILDIIGATQQVAFEKNDLMQFITNNGNTRVSFSCTHKSPARSLSVVYESSGNLEQIITSKPTEFLLKQEYYGRPRSGKSVVLSLQRSRPGQLVAIVNGVNSRPFDIVLTENDGLIQNIVARPTTSLNGPSELLDVELQVVDALMNARRIYVENSNDLTVIAKDGRTKTVFMPASNSNRGSGIGGARLTRAVYELLPETYMENGQYIPLFPGSTPSSPITVDFQEASPGYAEVTLHAANTKRWTVEFNPADGWVRRVSPGTSTLMTGTPEMMDVETRLGNIISKLMQVAFERDGMIHFIKDASIGTRVAFRRVYDGRRLQSVDSLGMSLLVDQSTYMHDGQLEPLFGSAASSYPILLSSQQIKPGHLNVILDGVHTVPYNIYYDHSSGLVTEVRASPSDSEVVVLNDNSLRAERRIQDIISQCKSVTFLNGGGIKFRTNNGGVASNVVTVGEYVVKPETYFRNGRFEPFFTGPSFPISVKLVQDQNGNAKAVLRAINRFTYLIKFQRRDGWVLNRMKLSESRISVTPQEADTENKLKEIFGNVQQLAFETDGVLQFITNNGNIRISFRGKTHNWWEESVYGRRLGKLDQVISSSPSSGYGYLGEGIASWPSSGYGNLGEGIANWPSYPSTRGGLGESIVSRPSYPTYYPPMHQERPISPLPPYGGGFGRKTIIPGSYRFRGRTDRLFVDREYPIWVDVKQPYSGYVEVSYHGIPEIVYGFEYQPQDGWVINRKVIRDATIGGSWEQRQVEERLRYIFTNAQQLAFESSGQLQFITDNSQTRISFM